MIKKVKYLRSIFPFIFQIFSILVIMNIKLSSHGFLFHRNINRRENKAQIPLIIHQNEKNQRIYFWCATKDNWASEIRKWL